jgi:hypothetical protein
MTYNLQGQNLIKSIKLKMSSLSIKNNHGFGFNKIVFLVIFIFQLIPLSGQVSISDSITAEQIEYINKLINQDKKNAQIWWYGWLAGYSAATVAQGIVFFSTDIKSTRQDMALGAATTALGAAGQLIAPLIPKTLSIEDCRNAENPVSPSSYRLTYSEELLKEIAEREKKGRSWKMHALTGAVNLSTGLITWLGFKRSVWEGVEIFALNTAVTELQIWTQPTRAIKDYKNYCAKYGTVSGTEASISEKEWIVLVYPGGIKIELNF